MDTKRLMMLRGYEITLRTSWVSSVLAYEGGREGLTEIVGISRGWCDHGDDGYQPVDEETGERCVEWLVACPDFGEW